MKLSSAIDESKIARSDLSPVTIRDYLRYLNLWLDFVDDCDVEDFTRQDLERSMAYMREEYVMKYGRPLSRAGLANCWTALRSFWHWASDPRREIENVSEGLKTVHVPEPVVVPHSKEDIQAAIEACYHSALANAKSGRRTFRYDRPEAYRDVAIVLTLLDTGLRAGELSASTWSTSTWSAESLKSNPTDPGESRGAASFPSHGIRKP